MFSRSFNAGGLARHSSLCAKGRSSIVKGIGRWCKLAIVLPIHTRDGTSSYFLEYLAMLPATHVHNPARCSIVWRARTPKSRFY